MKRGNDNSQMRSDEVERLNDEESEERGTFKRASAEVLASRKIFKSKRPNVTNTDQNGIIAAINPFAAPLTSTVVKPADVLPSTDSKVLAVNPFVGFQGLNKQLESKEAPKLASSNPFAGFQGLNNTVPSTSNINSSVVTASSKSDTKDVYASSSDVPFTDSVEVSGSEYKKKMRKLNSSFFKWTSRQIAEHPQSMWRDGIQDYIRYSEELAAKFGIDVNSVGPPAAITSTSAAPFGFSVAKQPEAAPEAFTKAKKAKAPLAMFSQTASTFSGTFAFDKPLVFDAVPAAKTPVTVLPPFSFGGAGPTPVPSFSSTFAFLPAATAPASTVKSSGGFGGFDFGTNVLTKAPPTQLSGIAPTGSIGWSLPSTGAPAPFSFGKLPESTSVSTQNDTMDTEGGDDEGEPVLEPEKVLRDVKDTDTILLDVPCKLYGYSKAGNEWKDTGKGSFRVTRSADTNKQRMLVRNPIGKLTFNAGFYKGMQIEKVKGGVRFSAFVATEDPSKPELKGFWVKMKEENAALAIKALEAGVDSCQ